MSPKENEIEVVYKGHINEDLDQKLLFLFDELKYKKVMENYDFLDRKKTIIFSKRS